MVLGLSVTAWMLSLLLFVGWTDTFGSSHFRLHRGNLVGGRSDLGGLMPPAGWTFLWSPDAPRWRLPGVGLPRFQGRSLLWHAVVPLWIPAVVSASILSVPWTWKRRSHIGHCPTCGYDLTGIDGVCPECGSPRP